MISLLAVLFGLAAFAGWLLIAVSVGMELSRGEEK